MHPGRSLPIFNMINYICNIYVAVEGKENIAEAIEITMYGWISGNIKAFTLVGI